MAEEMTKEYIRKMQAMFDKGFYYKRDETEERFDEWIKYLVQTYGNGAERGLYTEVQECLNLLRQIQDELTEIKERLGMVEGEESS